MTSFVITSSDKTKRQEYIKKYCQSLTIDPLDLTTIEKDTAIKQNLQTIGIEEIKNMQKKLFLKPIKSITKAIILEDAHLLTTQAQNALLKSLEEPPDHTIIILSSDSKEPLLPTILSRCQIIELRDDITKLSDQEFQELTEFIKKLPDMDLIDKLKKAESLAKDKEKAIAWTTNMIVILRKKMLEIYSSSEPSSAGESKSNNETKKQSSNNIINIIKSFQSLHTLLKTTNVNARFAIENILLQIA